MLNDDQKWPVPTRFRASLDMSDEAAYALLVKCDAEQKELGSRINAPFTTNTPLERARSKAFITLETLAKVQAVQELEPDQVEIMAEAFAAIGRYDMAAETSQKNAELYEQYWNAVWLDDADWCSHADQHKYVKEQVFSVKEGKEMPLLACNICHVLNVLDIPESLQKQRDLRAKVRSETKGMSMDDAKRHMNANYRQK